MENGENKNEQDDEPELNRAMMNDLMNMLLMPIVPMKPPKETTKRRPRKAAAEHTEGKEKKQPGASSN